jgi:hypothetical protein
MQTSQVYRITVEGRLDENWAQQLGGMSIDHGNGDGGQPLTTLVGSLADRSALIGVLNTLHDLNLTLLSVEVVGDD